MNHKACYQMNYLETIEYIHSTPKFSRELGNDLLCRLLEKSGNPQSNLQFIHIAGTNGKGSAASMLSEVLTLSGYKTGLYTSPYITRYNERMKINGVEISDTELAEITSDIRGIIEKYDTPVSEFALGTAIAFTYFKNHNCDIVVLETGLGGRLDATNVIKSPIASVIMSIGLDHTQYLGDTIDKITKEKCGIIKQNCPTVVYPELDFSCLEIIKEVCKNKNSDIYLADMPNILRGKTFEYNGTKYTLSLDGRYQKLNAATVVTVINLLNKKGYRCPDAAVKQGLKNAKNPGRLEKLPCGLILDGAHNPPAVNALADTVKTKKRPVFLCLAMMQDKDIDKNIDAFIKFKPQKVIITSIPDMPRCASPKLIAAGFKKAGITTYIESNPIMASLRLLELCKGTKNAFSLISGSLYLVGEVRRFFADINLKNPEDINELKEYYHSLNPQEYYIYILRCDGDTLYTGYTTNLKRRYQEHLLSKKGAKYTKSHKPQAIAAAWQAGSLSSALKAEAFIKKLSKGEKEDLIANPKSLNSLYQAHKSKTFVNTDTLADTDKNTPLKDFIPIDCNNLTDD